jgi:hypothetical protein
MYSISIGGPKKIQQSGFNTILRKKLKFQNAQSFGLTMGRLVVAVFQFRGGYSASRAANGSLLKLRATTR